MSETNTMDVKNGLKILPNGTKEWYLNGKLHRDENDGPALIHYQFNWWCQNDKLHRIGGPAVERRDGAKIWYQHGVLHRTDGPAVIFIEDDFLNKTEKWFINGRLHRLDGPAIKWYTGDKEWFICGYKCAEDFYEKFIKIFKKSVKSHRFKKWTRTRAFCEYYYQPDKIGGILAKRVIKNSLKTL